MSKELLWAGVLIGHYQSLVRRLASLANELSEHVPQSVRASLEEEQADLMQLMYAMENEVHSFLKPEGETMENTTGLELGMHITMRDDDMQSQEYKVIGIAPGEGGSCTAFLEKLPKREEGEEKQDV